MVLAPAAGGVDAVSADVASSVPRKPEPGRFEVIHVARGFGRADVDFLEQRRHGLDERCSLDGVHEIGRPRRGPGLDAYFAAAFSLLSAAAP